MSWDADTDVIFTAARDLLASLGEWTTIVGMGNETNRLHYPDIDLSSDPDVPMAVFQPVSDRSERFADGMKGLPDGEAEWVIYYPDTATDAQIERDARLLGRAMVAAETRLDVTSYETEIGGMGDEADSEHHKTVVLTIFYGLE